MTVTDIHPRPLYELRGVTKTYGQGAAQIHAVRELDLTIDEGELVAIAGPSGSGKTTLLQLLGALDRPTNGQVLFEGRDLAKLADGELTKLRAATIGFVFQQFNLIPTLNARQNVEVALAPQGLPGDVRRSKAEHLLSSVGLERRGDHLPSMLSGGEQQRVAIARAMANEPRVLLADEPTGNLDSATGQEIMALLRSLSLERKQTIVVVTHNQEIAATAGRVVRMQDGAVVDGDPAVVEAQR
ncbi:MAG: ABC transporter ATP-binding protein [Gaiellaceae bacterium]